MSLSASSVRPSVPLVQDLAAEAQKKQKTLDQLTKSIEAARKELRDLRLNVKAVRASRAHLLNDDLPKVPKGDEDPRAEWEEGAPRGYRFQHGLRRLSSWSGCCLVVSDQSFDIRFLHHMLSQ